MLDVPERQNSVAMHQQGRNNTRRAQRQEVLWLKELVLDFRFQVAKAWAELSHQEVPTQQEQSRHSPEHFHPKFPVVMCVPVHVDAPPVEVSDWIRVCRNHEKGWCLEARVNIPAGKRVVAYPVTIKADPPWPTKHLSPDKIAQQPQYLMPIYAKRRKTNSMYKVKHLVGDVSQWAPVEFEGAPCVAVYHSKVIQDKGIIDKGVIRSKVLLDKGIVRN